MIKAYLLQFLLGLKIANTILSTTWLKKRSSLNILQSTAELLCTVGPDYANLARGRAASLVARRAPEGFDKVFFTNAGADASRFAYQKLAPTQPLEA